AIACGQINGEIVRIISSSSKAYALERAKHAGIEGIALPKARFATLEACNEARHKAIMEAEPDLVVLAGYLGILPAQTTQALCGKILNIHPALIPSFCGKGYFGHHVHQAVLDFGAKISGATVHFVEEGIDSGPIVLQEAVPVLPQDDADSLAARVLTVEHRLLPRAVALFCADALEVDGRHVTIRVDETNINRGQ
nr:phosphoribosylglycinamide formyltransferase [bacterium]